jgi:hypothetical protein
MITVDCREIESIKHELLVYVSDQVAAIPALKTHEFMLSPIEDHLRIEITEVVTAIKEFLDSIGEARNFAVLSRNDLVMITSISGKTIKREPTISPAQMFSCPHCGFVTQYFLKLCSRLFFFLPWGCMMQEKNYIVEMFLDIF